MLGDTLTVGDVALLLGPDSVDTYFFLDEFSTVSGFEYSSTTGLTGELVPGDIENMFVINVIDALEANGFTGISMSIKVLGVDFDYSCAPCAGLTTTRSLGPSTSTMCRSLGKVQPAVTWCSMA